MEYFAVIAFFLALSAPTNADGSLGGPIYAPGHASLDYYDYPRYAFEYAVRDPHTGDNKAQWEKRDGDLVIGAYSLVEPDGSLRVVEYRADDKSGFNAVVKRIGPNIHPVATPIYKALIPSLGYKSYLPHPIGPVAGLEKLASAPIYAPAPSITSIIKELTPIAPIGKIIEAPILPPPIYAPAPAIIKEAAPIAPLGKNIQTPILPPPIYAPAPAIIKQAAPISPLGKIIAAPILPSAPIYNAEIIPKPLYNGPIYKEPYLPLYKAPLPIYKAPQPYGPAIIPPIIKPAPLLPQPIYSPYIGKGLPGLKNLESYNLLDKDILDYKRLLDYKAPLDYKGILEYSAPLIYKGYPGLGYTHK